MLCDTCCASYTDSKAETRRYYCEQKGLFTNNLCYRIKNTFYLRCYYDS
jgi:hypothetical protein